MTWIRPYAWCDAGSEMGPDAAFAHPGDLANYSGSSVHKSIGIVGGGIAGLVAAYELQRLGHDVTVFEADDRWGGRILTERFGNDDGPYAELGAMRIPHGHRCVDYYVDSFGLESRHFVSENNEGWLAFRGARFRRRDWPSAAALFGATRGHRPILRDLEASMGRPPDREMWGQAIGDWARPELRALEGRGLGQLAQSTIDDEVITASEWDWIGNLTGFRWIEDCSVLFWDNVGSLLDPAGRYELVGGMSKLTGAFIAKIEAAAPAADLRLITTVSRVTLRDGKVLLTHSRGEDEFDYAILAVPAPCAARLEFAPEVPADQRDAWRSLYYFPIAKSVALFDRRFWEADDRIFGGSSVTDLPNQQVWYPSDNAEPMTDADTEHLQIRLATLFNSALSTAPAEPTDWKGRVPEASERPGALIAGYMWGVNAQRFAALDEKGRDDLIEECLRRIHPDIPRPAAIAHRVWAQYLNPGGGGFAYFRPNEQRRFASLLCQPHPWVENAEPRVFFAGEHDGIAQGWIQGAIQSGLAAAASVLSSP